MSPACVFSADNIQRYEFLELACVTLTPSMDAGDVFHPFCARDPQVKFMRVSATPTFPRGAFNPDDPASGRQFAPDPSVGLPVTRALRQGRLSGVVKFPSRELSFRSHDVALQVQNQWRKSAYRLEKSPFLILVLPNPHPHTCSAGSSSSRIHLDS